MPETRHRTTIQVDVDDRAIQKLGQELERAIDPTHMAAFERSIERSNRAIERLTRATERMTRASSALARATAAGAGAGGAQGPQRRPMGFAGSMAATAVGTALGQGRLGGNLQRMVNFAGAPAGGEGFLGGMFNAIPYAGPVLSSAISGAQRYYQQYIGAQQARYGAFGQTGVVGGGPSSTSLLGLGYGPSQQPGVLQSMAQRSGRSGAALEQIAGQAGLSQRFLGVDPSSILGGAETQGPVGNPQELMAQAIASAMVIGFRRTNWTEAVDGLGQAIGDLQRQGIQIDANSLIGLYRGLGMGARGIGGPAMPGLVGRAGAAFAQNIVSQGQRVGQGSSSFDFLMLQAAGGGRGGGRSLMEAQIFGERHGGEVFFNLLERLQGMSSGSQADREQLGHYLAQNMGISSDLAMQLASMPPEQVQAMRLASENAGVGATGMTTFLQQQMDLAGGPAGAAEREAGLEAQRVGIGGAVAPAVQQMQDAEIALVTVFMPAAMNLVSRVMGAAQELVTAFQQGGVAAVLARVGEMMTALMGGVGGAVQTGAHGLLGGAADMAAAQYGENHPVTVNLRRMQAAVAPSSTQGGAGAGGGTSAGPQPTLPAGGGPAVPAAGTPVSAGGGGASLDPWEALQRHSEGVANAVRQIRRRERGTSDARLETV